jgi:5-methylcytosine-specific restriction endonuclease McrA
MGKLHQKMPRLRLPAAEYQALRNQVLKRDGWHCQLCGTSNNLHVHHVKSRSSLGDDAMRNLITLCVKCHEALHRRTDFTHDIL